MPDIRIYTLAKHLKIDSNKLVGICDKLGIVGKCSCDSEFIGRGSCSCRGVYWGRRWGVGGNRDHGHS